MSKNKGQFGFFDLENQLDKIYEINDFLPKLKSLVDFEIFREDLDTVRPKETLTKAGRPPFDAVLMFKILVLKSMYNLSDDQTELQIRDRLSFRDFLGLSYADTVPDAKTIWTFAELLKNNELEQKLFDRFGEELDRQGFAAKSGLIVDGTFVETPKRRLSKGDNEQLKSGVIPESVSSNPNVLSQTDLDAEWATTCRRGISSFRSVGVNTLTLFAGIRKRKATSGSDDTIRCGSTIRLDGRSYLDVMPQEPEYPEQEAFGDSAYAGEKIDTELKSRGYQPFVCEKGYRNKPLTDAQKALNHVKSSVRCRVEHIFGAQKMRMGNEVLRSIGFARARFWIGMRNLMSNMSRLVSLKRLKAVK